MQMIFDEEEGNLNEENAGEERKDFSPALYFGKLLRSRDVTHLIHLKNPPSKNFALHVAMEEFYKKILKLTDKLIESYSGIYGIQEIEIERSMYEEPNAYMWDLYECAMDARETFKETWIQNQVDEIQALIAQTLFKITDKDVINSL